jgi:hypothetical protein
LRHKGQLIQSLEQKPSTETGLLSKPEIARDETNETIHDIARKNRPPTSQINNATPTPNRSENMLKPTFRLFIIPLGAVATLASLSSQNVAPRAQRDAGSTVVREQVVDCSTRNVAEVCVIK